MEGYLSAMRRYAVFRGRASRMEFGQFVGVFILVGLGGLFIDKAVLDDSELMLGVIGLTHLLPWLAVCARRLHDMDKSGWFCLVGVVPYLGFGMILLGGPEGTVGPNRYGPDPVARGDPAEPVATLPLPDFAPDQRPAWQPATPAATPYSTRSAPMPVSAPPPPPVPPPFDLITELERLAKLRSSGVLSEAEFEVLKAQALAQGRRA